MTQQPQHMEDLPNICGDEPLIEQALRERPAPLDRGVASPADFGRIRSAAAVALHMHQPLIPAGGGDLHTAALIGNLQYMMEHQDVGDNHNAPVFLRCYARMGDFIPQLLDEGKAPRVMLEYSGTLLHGLRQMGADEALESLKRITCEERYRGAVEWLGCPWGHAVAPSTPIQDYRLHVRAWQHHFAALFGLEALSRVRGFSPSEMALPNHPDVAYEFVRTLRDCGFTWVLVQEHTVEQPQSGFAPERKHLPHRLVCRNSHGAEASITALVKTQGSDTKLVAQMQPYYEARGLGRSPLGTASVPPLVIQIADGENGGVMMNEFPPKYLQVVRESSGTDTALVNASEYLDQLFAAGIQERDLPVLQPIHQKRIWDRLDPGGGPERLAAIIHELERDDHRFHMEGGSWTNNVSWVRGYENLLGPMEKVSAMFYQRAIKTGVSTRERRYRNALFHLMASQTSCYRYWGQGLWTDYGREIVRRCEQILLHDF
jgi:hypothetical protein